MPALPRFARAPRPDELRSRLRAALFASTVLVLSGLPAPSGASSLSIERSTEPAGSADAATSEVGRWERFGSSPHVDGRVYHHVVAAPEIGKLVVIGGYTMHGLDDDVWLLDLGDPGAGWSLVEPAGEAPRARVHATTIWDPKGGQVVMFGGIAADGPVGLEFLNDVWALRFEAGGTLRWVRLHEGGSVDDDAPTSPLLPDGRGYHLATFDAQGGDMLVHGGVDAMGFLGTWASLVDALQWRLTGQHLWRYALKDTWSFDLESGLWTKLPDSPTPRFGHQGAFDPVNRQLVVTGGIGPGPTPDDDFDREETEGLDLATGTWTRWNPAGVPPSMTDAAFGYSSDLGGLVAMSLDHEDGEVTDPNRVHGLRFGPGGAGAEWTVLRNASSPRRPLFGMRGAVVPGPDRFAILGGSLGGFGDFKDHRLSLYEVRSGRWTRPLNGVEPLPATAGPKAAYDPDRNAIVTLGGLYNDEGPMWQLGLADGRWSAIRAPGGPGEGIPVHDPWNHRMLVLDRCLDRIWSLTSAWKVVETVGEVPRLCGAHVVADPARERLIVFGGHIHGLDGSWSIQNRDVFALELSPSRARPLWRELSPSGAVAFPAAAPAVFDPVGDRAIFTAEADGKTWSLDFTGGRDGAWVEVPATGQTAAWHTSVRVYDAANHRLVAYDGCWDGKVRVLDLGPSPAWSVLETTDDPAEHCEGTGAYDPVGRRLVIYAGRAADSFGEDYRTSDSYALPLGGQVSSTPGPSDPATDPDPVAGSVGGGRWASWGPEHLNGQDVDLSLANPAEALVASTTRTNFPPRGAGIYRSADAGRSWAPSEGATAGIGMTEIAQSPADPSRVYAASVTSSDGVKHGAGMYVSRDGGATWNASAEGLPLDSYWSVAAHPDDPLVAWTAGKKGGLYRTDDGGASWQEVARGELEGLWVNALAVTRGPSGAARLVAGVRQLDTDVNGQGGVYLSDDDGSSWTLGFSTYQQFVKALAVDPSDPRRILAAEGYGVWRSEDGGETWQHANGGTWKEPSGNDVHLGSVEFDPSSGGQIAFGGGLAWPCDFKDGVSGGAAAPPNTPYVFRTEDGGATWTKVEDLPPDLWCGLAVSGDGRTILASGIYSGLWRSDDGGATWAYSSRGISQVYVSSVAPHPTLAGTAVAAAGRSGILVTADGGKTWEQAVGGEDGEQNVYAVSVAASPAKPGRFVAMAGGAWVSDDGGHTWNARTLPASGGYVGFPAPPAMHPTDPDVWFFDAEQTEFGGRGLGITRDNGRTYESHLVRDPTTFLTAGCPANIALDPTNPDRIFIGDRCGNGMFRSLDGGTTWKHVSEEIGQAYVTALAVNPSRPDEVWFATEHRGVFRSSDGGETWSGARTPGLGYKEVRGLVVSPSDPDRVFAAAIDHGVYETNDGGASWTKIDAGMPSRAPVGLSADPSGRIFAGTWTGGVMVLG